MNEVMSDDEVNDAVEKAQGDGVADDDGEKMSDDGDEVGMQVGGAGDDEGNDTGDEAQGERDEDDDDDGVRETDDGDGEGQRLPGQRQSAMDINALCATVSTWTFKASNSLQNEATFLTTFWLF